MATAQRGGCPRPQGYNPPPGPLVQGAGETAAGLQLVRDNTRSGFSINITLYGQADKKIADRVKRYVERTNRRQYRLSE